MKLRLYALLTSLSLLGLASCKDRLPSQPPDTPKPDTIAMFTFDNNSKDVTGHGHDGTASGNVAFGPDRFGNAASALIFADLQAGVSVASKPDLNFTGQSSYSIAGWIQTGTSYQMGVFTNGPSDQSHPGYQLDINNGVAVAKITDASPNNLILTGSTFVSDSMWHFIVLSVSAQGTASLYVDGALENSKADGLMSPELGGYGGPNIGRLPSGGAFVGSIDEVVVYAHALDLSEVQTRFHEGGWVAHHDTTVATHPKAGWTMTNFGTTQSIEGICFPNPALGFACGFNGTILKSTDSGATWKKLNSRTSQNLYRISFKDAQNGIVGGDAGTLLITSDGGAVWTANSTFNASDNIRDLVYTASGEMFFAGGTGTGTSGGFIVHSYYDGGEWEGANGIGATFGTMYSIGVSSQLITVVGSGGGIFNTSDTDYGGHHMWSAESVNDAGDDFLGVCYSAGGNLTAAMAVTAYGTIYKTSNGGTGWGSPTQSPVTSSLRTVRSVSADEWWIAGDDGVILHTTNGGGNWTKQFLPQFLGQWNDIVPRDAHHLAFIGENGELAWLSY